MEFGYIPGEIKNLNKLVLLVILHEDEKLKIQKKRKKGNENRKTF